MQLLQCEGSVINMEEAKLIKMWILETLVKDDLNYYSGRVDFRVKRLNIFKMPSQVDRMGQWVKALTTEPGNLNQIPAICMMEWENGLLQAVL